MIEFQGHLYFDDRMFVLYIGRCVVSFNQDGSVATTIYHEDAPPEAIWCLLTYRNCYGFPAFSINHFNKKQTAVDYLRRVEASVPLISLGGKPLDPAPSYEEFVKWKVERGFLEFDYRDWYPAGRVRTESLMQTSEDFSRSASAILEQSGSTFRLNSE